MGNVYSEMLSGEMETRNIEDRECGIILGKVTDVYDSQKPGMIRVEYFLRPSGTASNDWMKYMTPYAGKESGSFFMPEKGTEVVVAFDHGNRSCPVALGCLWTKLVPIPKESANADNCVKKILSKGGNQIFFNDKDGKEEIEIATKGGLKIQMADEKENIIIQNKSGKTLIQIDGKNGSVKLEAEKKLELSVGGKSQITIDSSVVKIKNGSLELSADQSMKLKGQTANLSGSSVEVKADGSLKLEASGVVQLKGSMAKIN